MQKSGCGFNCKIHIRFFLLILSKTLEYKPPKPMSVPARNRLIPAAQHVSGRIHTQKWRYADLNVYPTRETQAACIVPLSLAKIVPLAVLQKASPKAASIPFYVPVIPDVVQSFLAVVVHCSTSVHLSAETFPELLSMQC